MKKALCIVAAVLASALPFTGCKKKEEDKSGQQSEEEFITEPCVSYGEFGAVGDGKTDDFEAIKRTHEYANRNGVAVKADSGKKYYIGAVEDTVTVKTNVYWGNAQFIIDDKSAADDSKVWWYPLFAVKSYEEPTDVPLPEGYSLAAGQKNIGLTFEKGCMLAVYNEDKRDFIRHGAFAENGYARQEVILVDKLGNVDNTTPIQWDYEKVTKMTAYSIDDSPLTLRGGSFTTVANDDPVIQNYFERGIRVERANTTVKGVKHYVTGEGATGSPYNGFFRARYANNVEFSNCVMTGHKVYKNTAGNTQGTYDTRLFGSNNVRYLNCTQANSHTDPTYWGVMCSDFCKNLLMDGCKLSRFDAHMGVYNATVKNSDIGQNISVVGGGVLRVENVTRRCEQPSMYFNRFVTLREDYGSFFYGDIIIKDSVLITSRGINYVLAGQWYDWDFGYECRFPTNVTLDNVRIEYKDVVDTYIHPHLFIFSHMTEREGETPGFAAASGNPPRFTEKVTVLNNQTVFKMTANTMGWFEDTELIYE